VALIHFHAYDTTGPLMAEVGCPALHRVYRHTSVPGRGARYTRLVEEVTCPKCLQRVAAWVERSLSEPGAPADYS
jgi:hypothetical protein